ncbi:MAG: DUF6298 domain-containing protein [Paludibacter sp.]|nr:DUF6298 domain-containing protein [Paludibacter sp.]
MNNLKLYFATFCAVVLSTFQYGNAQEFPLKVKNDKITYIKDAKGNRILDFSYCGYKSSEQDIPDIKNVIFVPQQDADASDAIQRAINYVSALKPDINGYRGAVLLDKGVFNVSKSLWITASGVVLRGTDKHETVILRHGVDRSAVLHIEGINNLLPKDTFKVTSNYVPVNEKTFEVNSVAGLRIGDRLKIVRPCTSEWIKSVGCDIFGGGISALGWKEGDMEVNWDRTITAIKGNEITIDAPLTVAIDSKFGGATVTKYVWNGRISESGVENMTMTSDYNKKYAKDEDHCWTGVSIENAENCWVRQMNFNHFAGNAVFLQPNSSKTTVEDCISLDPVSEIGGFRRIIFYTMGQQNLFQRCYSENGINDFAAGYCAPGPNAFVQCESKGSLGFSGAIDAWACGLLFDIVNIDGNNLTFKNLGQDKNGAGWGTSNSLFWQCTASELECFSPAKDAQNRAYGCWGQFSGDGQWYNSNNHVQPRSIYYDQLATRLNQDVSARGRILPKNTNASSSPSLKEAAEMVKESYIPLLTTEKWIEQAVFKPSVDHSKLLTVNELKSKPMKVKAYIPEIGIVNGRIVCDGALITGAKLDVQWWSGKLKPKYINSNLTKPGVTRFVPGREGFGLTDRIDSVVSIMKRDNFAVLDHNYGLWADRRRDGHERVRERDGDVWAPFYEQPFGRSSEGIAWDGLSKYDLNRPNAWYWYRLKDFADKAGKDGMLLYHENFFQHNIIEAGAHWVDCPWRSANNINDLGFPEPINFAGDKRIYRADMFYDISVPVRREYYRNYIRQCLNNFADNKNVIQLISAEFTGPLKFVRFWLDVIGEWEKETGKKATVALSTTKDVQDSILADPKRSSLVDVIDIRYWHYKSDGSVYAPKGGQNLAPRQFARIMKVGNVTFKDAYKAVSEYRTKYPEKAVIYDAENYPGMAWAVFMAGGSCPVLPSTDKDFLKAAAKMDITLVNSENYKELEKSGIGIIIYSQSESKIPVQLEKGKYALKFINGKTGEEKVINKSLKGAQTYQLNVTHGNEGAYWFQKL